MAPAAGAFQNVKVENAGTSAAIAIPAGHELSFVVGGWWAIPGSPAMPHCGTAIADVTAARIPVTAGSIKVALGTTFVAVCRSTASMSLEIKTAA